MTFDKKCTDCSSNALQIIFVLACAVTVAHAQVRTYKGYEYRLFTASNNFEAAQLDCVDTFQGNLASILSQDEADWVNSKFRISIKAIGDGTPLPLIPEDSPAPTQSPSTTKAPSSPVTAIPTSPTADAPPTGTNTTKSPTVIVDGPGFLEPSPSPATDSPAIDSSPIIDTPTASPPVDVTASPPADTTPVDTTASPAPEDTTAPTTADPTTTPTTPTTPADTTPAATTPADTTPAGTTPDGTAPAAGRRRLLLLSRRSLQQSASEKAAWIGYKVEADSWTDGSVKDFKQFNGQPTDGCAVVDGETGKWRTVACSTELPYICKRVATAAADSAASGESKPAEKKKGINMVALIAGVIPSSIAAAVAVAYTAWKWNQRCKEKNSPPMDDVPLPTAMPVEAVVPSYKSVDGLQDGAPRQYQPVH